MKQLIPLCLFVIFLVCSNSSHGQQVKMKSEPGKVKAKANTGAKEAKVKKEDDKIIVRGEGVGKEMVYPYTAEYSSQFVPGSPAQGKLVLDMWKAWDDNAYERGAAYFADTAVMELPDGQVLRGKDSIMVAMRRYRSALVTAKSTIEAWTPLKSLDRNENWVVVWGSEEDTDQNGKVSSIRYHEVWRFNKDGKVYYVRQYTTPMPKY